MENSQPVSSPMTESFWNGINKEVDKAVMDTTLYQQMIWSLLYLALRTHLDILPAVLILARFQTAPTLYCIKAGKCVIKYLNGTRSYGFKNEAGTLDISCFVDSDYAEDVVDRKCMSGFMVKLRNAECFWTSKKEPTVALSTCEAEYHAMTHAAKEIIWVSRVLQQAEWRTDNKIEIRSNSQSAISSATSEESPSARAKHIDF